MTPNIQTPNVDGIGYLTVRVSTAGGAIPLEYASVNVRGADIDASDIIYSLSTNSDGLTPTVSLATPPLSASTSPQNSSPSYAVYNIDVYADGYVPAFFNNVPIFSGINSVQPAILVPRLSGSTQYTSQNVTETGDQNVEGELYDR
ncbi:MAG: hypothetical protein E7653_07250 [Ruminococcaceae bacterium]|nr:hypothetical protein [Oscillospiraceae bacterium]